MKKRNLFMSATIMCAFLSIAITFKIEKTKWLWESNKPVAVVLIIVAVIFGALWFQAQRKLTAKV
ncbi:hypothetical protein [Mucilaginibacter sp. HD30]